MLRCNIYGRVLLRYRIGSSTYILRGDDDKAVASQ